MLCRISIVIIILIMGTSCALRKSTSEKPNEVVDAYPEIEGMEHISGSFLTMGSRHEANEKPVHEVYVKGFYLDRKEVTVEEFEYFCRRTNRKMPDQPRWSQPDHPVVNVTWQDAAAYAEWVGKRLPTEAEWEYAARGNHGSLKYAPGRDQAAYFRSYGNIADESLRREKLRAPIRYGYDDGFAFTAPVGSMPANLFGIYDLDGNVLEWCRDWYSADYYKNSDKMNPTGPADGQYRVVRGGSWNRTGKYLRVSYRTYYPPKVRFNFLGFRCAMDEEAVDGNMNTIADNQN
ncbi:MAG: SUMF1/EgtB/PvdO family nonheme iron enzyme [Caldithrix sp.]|nr:SUMF1/EgtB/PvdO family nonheme iron enzyme [Caldithrix sp.]